MTDSEYKRRDRAARRRTRQERVVDGLRREGLLESTKHHKHHKHRSRRHTAALALTGMAIVAVSAAGGYAIGHGTHASQISSAPVRIQQTGDAYVHALRALDQRDEPVDSTSAAQGREAGLAAMLSAATALVDARPADTTIVTLIHQLRAARWRPGEAR